MKMLSRAAMGLSALLVCAVSASSVTAQSGSAFDGPSGQKWLGAPPTGQERVPLVLADGTGRVASAAQIAGLAPTAGIVHTLIVEGDSMAAFEGSLTSASQLWWSLATTPIRINYDPQTANEAIGGSYSDDRVTLAGSTASDGNSYAAGILNATRLARFDSMQAATKADVARLHIGTNDFYASTPAASVLANIQTWITHARSVGIRRIIVDTVEPRGAAGTGNALNAINSASMLTFNRSLLRWAATQPDVIVNDQSSLFLSPTSTTYAPIGDYSSGAGGQFAPYQDALHRSDYGAYLGRSTLSQVLAQVFPARPWRTPTAADTYDATSNPTGYLFVASQSFAGTGGTVSGLTGGTVTTGTNAPAGWTFQGALNGMTITFAGSVSSGFNTLLGRSDLTCSRLTFSGTPTAAVSISIAPSIYPGQGSSVIPVSGLTGPFVAQFDVYATALQGVTSIAVRHNLISSPATYRNYGLPVAGLHAQLPQLDGAFSFRTPPIAAISGIDRVKPDIYVGFQANVAASGSLDLCGFSGHQVL